MELSGFSVSEYGVFDSRMKFSLPDGTVTRERPVQEFELELYADAQPERFSLNGQPVNIPAGTLLVAKPGYTRHSRLHFRCYYIHILPTSTPVCSALAALPDLIRLPAPEDAISLFRELLRVDPDRGAAEELDFQARVLRLLQYVFEVSAIRTGAFPQKDLHRNGYALHRSAEYMRENYAEDLSLAALASMTHLSPAYYQKQFTALYGMSPGQYLLSCRLDAAKLLILEQEASLAEVAESCGFSSQSYFGKQFRRHTGLTPTEYRRQMLGRMQL